MKLLNAPVGLYKRITNRVKHHVCSRVRDFHYRGARRCERALGEDAYLKEYKEKIVDNQRIVDELFERKDDITSGIEQITRDLEEFKTLNHHYKKTMDGLYMAHQTGDAELTKSIFLAMGYALDSIEQRGVVGKK